MNKNWLVIAVASCMGLSCRPDLPQPSWEVDALTPLLKTRIDLADLALDTNLVAASDSSLSIVYRSKIAHLAPGPIASPFDQVFFNTVKLNNIDLGRRVIHEGISLGSIARQSGTTGALIIASNGTNQVIPPLSGIGPNNFTVDATQYFQSMTLRDGWLVLRMKNGFPIDLTNLQYGIFNQGGGAAILQNTIGTLAAGQVHYDSVQLNNNTTISGKLRATLFNMDSPGSRGQPVPIDTSDAIELTLTIDKLDPVSATAIFPEQNLAEDTSLAFISAPSAQLNKVHVAEGSLYLKATSTIDDVIKLDYQVPSASRGGQTLGFLESIPPAPPGGFSSKTTQVPVFDYDIDLTGLPDNVNVFNTFYTVFNARVDSSGNLINLSLQDSVFIETGIDSMIADRGYGFLGYDTIASNTTSDVQVFEALEGGQLRLIDLQLDLEIENYIGADLQVRLNQARAKGPYGAKDLQWNRRGQLLTLPRAQERQPGQLPKPGRLVVQLDKDNSNVAELLSLRPDSLRSDFEAFLNAGVSPTDYSQFLYTAYGLEAYLSSRLNLELALQDIALRDTARFELADSDPNQQFRGGNLRIVAHNHYPFSVQVDLVFLDANYLALDTLYSDQRIAAGLVGADGRVFAEQESEVKIPIERATVPALRNARYVVLINRFSTPGYPSAVQLYNTDYLDLSLVGELKWSTE